MNIRHWPIALLALALPLLAACGDERAQAPAADDNNGGGKTDDGGEDGGIVKALEGRDDPVAGFLRANARDDGTLGGNYWDVVAGVAQQMGCELSTQRTYVILLTRADNFPRNILTVCSDDPQKASQFFLSTQSDFGDLADIDPQNVKMIAWDKTARIYRTYEMTPLEDRNAGMKLDVSPTECHTCHTGSQDMDNSLVPFSPVMNELVNPWTLWNAEPDFRSHQFEDTINPAIKEAPFYKEMTASGALDSASNFEKHIRASMDRVTNARLRTRRDPANLDESLSLLRPMFCDESLNYVSENHFTGETHVSAVIDDSIRRLYLSIRPDNWPWAWLNDGRLRLPIPKEGEEPIAVMPVRGESTLQLEVSMVKRRVLTASQVLRVRALDWSRPVLSDFRCDLYKTAAARLRASPPDLTSYALNNNLIPVLFDEIMMIEVIDAATGTTVRKPLAPTDPANLIAIADAQSEDAGYALDFGDFDDFELTIDQFGEQLEDHFQSMQEEGRRADLEDARLERACASVGRFPSAPHIPGVDACE